MAKVHFIPYCAVKYVGAKTKELAVSTARPKPVLKKGDIVIVDKRMAFNLVKKGFEQFKEVEEISFTKNTVELEEEILALKESNEILKKENAQLEDALSFFDLVSTDETKNVNDENSTIDPSTEEEEK